jgi:hypothetical protein
VAPVPWTQSVIGLGEMTRFGTGVAGRPRFSRPILGTMTPLTTGDPTPTFTVDTHLFRELGELLVDRDSTALVELVKNAYDADATEVVVHGDSLSDSRSGVILITDNGVGMSADLFRLGFLRIASRVKEETRRSPKSKRRYTGAKGVGRLAAHKLAWLMEVESASSDSSEAPISASIDWEKIEKRRPSMRSRHPAPCESPRRRPAVICRGG